MFSAISCFKQLKSSFNSSGILKQLEILEILINEMNFDQARQFLNDFVKQLDATSDKDD